jgi:hypothetical protein
MYGYSQETVQNYYFSTDKQGFPVDFCKYFQFHLLLYAGVEFVCKMTKNLLRFCLAVIAIILRVAESWFSRTYQPVLRKCKLFETIRYLIISFRFTGYY